MDKKVIEYVLICENSLGTFNDEISAKLRSGWQLHGETFIFGDTEGYPNMYQAMIKYEDAF
jgi:hypothetical protein